MNKIIYTIATFVFLLHTAVCIFFIAQSHQNSSNDSSVSATKSILVEQFLNKDYKNPLKIGMEAGPLMFIEDGEAVFNLSTNTVIAADDTFIFGLENKQVNLKEGFGILTTSEIIKLAFSGISEGVFTIEPSIILVDAYKQRLYVLSGQIQTDTGTVVSANSYLEWQIDSFITNAFEVSKIKSSVDYSNIFDLTAGLNI